MKIINNKNELTVDLFHGTSTVFVDSIIKNGLGAIDPIRRWNLLEFGKDVYQLSEIYLKDTDLFKLTATFKNIVEQTNDSKMNYQHGSTYLSTLAPTAVNYSLNNPYGSEFLSCIMEFYKELLKINDKRINELSMKHLKASELVNIAPTPILIKIKNVKIDSLLNELGENPNENLNKIDECFGDEMKYRVRLDQCNFRLTRPLSTENIKIYHIIDGVPNFFGPYYNLKEYETPGF